jgi:hypothetical protein
LKQLTNYRDGDAYGTERLALVLLTIFAVVALILAGAGVYALLAYNDR